MRTVLGAAAARVKRRTAGARVAPVGFVVRRQYWSGRPPQLVAFRWAELLVLVVWGPVQELAVELLATGAGTWPFTPRWWNPLLVEVRASPITLALQVIWRVAAIHEVAPRKTPDGGWAGTRRAPDVSPSSHARAGGHRFTVFRAIQLHRSRRTGVPLSTALPESGSIAAGSVRSFMLTPACCAATVSRRPSPL